MAEDQMMIILKIIFFTISGIGLVSSLSLMWKIGFEKENYHGRKKERNNNRRYK